MDKKEIIDFIENFKYRGGIENKQSIEIFFLEGNCYWFAFILRERFSELDLFYDPVEGHFYAGDGDVFYDWLGMYTKPMLPNIIKLSVINTTDPVWYERILCDCKY